MTDFISTENPRENARALYELALADSGLPSTHKETAQEAFFRAGDFVYSRLMELQNELADFCEKTGMGAGATGFAGMESVAELDGQEALELYRINETMWHYERAKRQLVKMLLEYCTKKRGCIAAPMV